MSFFGSIFGGSNPTLNSAIGQAGQVASSGISAGEGLTSGAGNFFSSLMSGDPAQTSKLLAPQIQGMQQQAQQQQSTMSQFGNRSGGLNSKAQTVNDTTRTNVNNMVSKLTGDAANSAASLGTSMLNTGMSALNNRVDFSQQQTQNWSNSILGMGMTSAVSGAESSVMGA
jgi:hypothetical protein